MAGLVFALAPIVVEGLRRSSTAPAPHQQQQFRQSNPYARTTWRAEDASGEAQPPDYSRHHLDRCFAGGDVGDVMRRRVVVRRAGEGEEEGGGGGNTDEAEYETTEAFSLDLYNRLSLTFDKTLIYPTHPPSVALYYLPQRLDHEGDQISLELSVSPLPNLDGTRDAARGEDLYKMTRGPMWPWPHGPEYLIRPQRDGCCVVGLARMARSKTVTGSRWSVIYRGYSQDTEAQDEPATCSIQFQGGRWTHKQGVLLAVEEQSSELRILVFQGSIINDRPLQDLLVAAWCVRLWHKLSPGPTKAPPRRKSSVAPTEADGEEVVADPGRRWSLTRRGTR